MKIQDHGVYISKVDEYGKIYYEYTPLRDVKLTGKLTLGEYLKQSEAEFKAINKELNDVKEQVSKLTKLLAEHQKITEESFVKVIDEIERDKFL